MEKLELLNKNAWTYKDIMNYFDVSVSKAQTIKKRALKEFNGVIPFSTLYVKCDAVMNLFGSSREKEIELLTKGKDYDKTTTNQI